MPNFNQDRESPARLDHQLAWYLWEQLHDPQDQEHDGTVVAVVVVVAVAAAAAVIEVGVAVFPAPPVSSRACQSEC